MALPKGDDQATIAKNIAIMENSGHPHNQAVAVALKQAGKEKPADKK